MITAPAKGRLKVTAGFFLAISLAGCAPSLDPDQYGEVIYELPHVKGGERPYRLPLLEEPQESEDNAEK